MLNKTKLQDELESLHQIFLGIKVLHACAIPQGGCVINEPLFHFLNQETKKLVYGRLITLLSDNKSKIYNTSSYKILIEKVIKCKGLIDDREKKELETYLKCLKKIDDDYKTFRDKHFAHIELDENYNLLSLEDLKISNMKITKLMKRIERIHDKLFIIIHRGGTSDHLAGDIERLSQKIWSAYKQAGLVGKEK